MQYKTMKEENFDKIYRSFRDDVYKVSLYYTKEAYAAEDVAQKVFCEFFRHYDTVDEDCVRAYLIHSAKNLALNWLRDRKREMTGEYLDVIAEDHTPRYSVEDRYISDEQSHEREVLVSNMLQRLREENESWYHIIYLIFCIEKSHYEAASALGISRDVLYSKLYRAKKWLRKTFEDEFDKLWE